MGILPSSVENIVKEAQSERATPNQDRTEKEEGRRKVIVESKAGENK